MPQLVRRIDEIARERAQGVLFIRFGDPLKSSATVAPKRKRVLDRLTREGYAFEPCAPSPTSNWLSYLGDVAVLVAYAPGEATYEQFRRVFETEAGGMIDPDVVLCLYDPRVREPAGPW